MLEEHHNLREVLTSPLNSQISAQRASVGCVGQTSLIHGGLTSSSQGLKDLLLTSWCQIPQHTFRGLVESRPLR